MIRKLMVLLMICVMFVAISNATAEDAKHRVGGGARYWMTLNNIDVDNIDENGFAYFVTYQYRPAYLLKIEGAVELLPENYAGAPDPVFAPQIHVLLGRGVYGGAGIGGYFSDGEFADDPFYVLCAGLEAELFPHVLIDLRATYRVDTWDNFDLDNIDTDTITVGVAALIEI